MTDPHNLLLIDSTIPEVDTFVNGLNSNSHGVLYSIEDSFESLKEKIAALNVPHFDNVAFVFVDEHSPLTMFVSYNTFISFNDTGIIENNTTLFIKEIVDTYNVKNLDFLACNLLSYSEWKSYFEYLMAHNSGLVVRASDDRSGNLEAGGDWVLESTYDDVTHLYFNDAIGQWNYLLDLGSHSAMLGIDGNLYTCGSNSAGQLGRTGDARLFLPVSNLTNIVSVVTGSSHTVILRRNGEVWACGNGGNGRLGNGDTSNQILFVRSTFFTDESGNNPDLFEDISDATAIAAGISHTVILRRSGQVWACGSGSLGQLGDGLNGTEHQKLRFIRSTSSSGAISDATAIAAGGTHTVIIRGNVGQPGDVWACGYGANGRLGIGSVTSQTQFVRSAAFDNGISGSYSDISNATAIAAGESHTFILRVTGIEKQVWACGDGLNGRLGNGDTTDRSRFVRSTAFIYNESGITDASGVIMDAIAIATGRNHTVILRGSGDVWSCGRGTGQLGDGGTTDRSRFVRSTFFNDGTGTNPDLSDNIIDATVIATGSLHTVILRNNGQVWTCGLGTNGQLGNGGTSSRVRFIRSILDPNIKAKYTKVSTKNPPASGFINLDLSDNFVFFPDMVSNSLAASDVSDTSTTFISVGLKNPKILKLEPANTVFSDYISFDISGFDVSYKVYFKSDTDSQPVEITLTDTGYGAYYEVIDISLSIIRIYTNHFSEVGIGEQQGGGGIGDPYIRTITGFEYKLPVMDGYVRYYQGHVNGKLLTINAKLRKMNNSELAETQLRGYFDHKAKATNAKEDLNTILENNEVNFFEKLYMEYDGNILVINIWNQRMRIEEYIGNIKTTCTKKNHIINNCSSNYQNFPSVANYQFHFGPAILHVSLYDWELVRNAIYLQAPCMDQGNGIIVNVLSKYGMTIPSLDSKNPVVTKNTERIKETSEYFLDDNGYRVKKIITSY